MDFDPKRVIIIKSKYLVARVWIGSAHIFLEVTRIISEKNLKAF